MSTHMPGFLSFLSFLHHFVLGNLATSIRRVKLISTLGIHGFLIRKVSSMYVCQGNIIFYGILIKAITIGNRPCNS